MWTKLSILGCLLLTAFVVHTAARIEHVNVLCNQFLPRSDGDNEAWEIPKLQHVLNYTEDQIAVRRSNAFSMEHPEKQLPPEHEFFGEPYTTEEQKWIDRSVKEHADHTRLYWWVTNFGSPQYFLAPIAFIWATVNFLAIRKLGLRALSALCAALSFAAIFLMIFRAY